ncbi:MAG: 50S ribosomal protein L9 [Candidatus Abawacabacteria bacterium]|nr:50S ribosomal protein L9 [Candidatus Abawacabacteria bacterium]
MKLVLIQDVPHLGRKHDMVDVKPGYGRNFLLPRSLATFATPALVAQSQKMQAKRLESRKKMQEQAKELAQKIKNVQLTFARRVTSKGTLYGSVGASEIAKDLAKEISCSLDSEAIRMSTPIRKLGEHKVTIHLADDVEALIHLKVIKQA